MHETIQGVGRIAMSAAQCWTGLVLCVLFVIIIELLAWLCVEDAKRDMTFQKSRHWLPPVEWTPEQEQEAEDAAKPE